MTMDMQFLLEAGKKLAEFPAALKRSFITF